MKINYNFFTNTVEDAYLDHFESKLQQKQEIYNTNQFCLLFRYNGTGNIDNNKRLFLSHVILLNGEHYVEKHLKTFTVNNTYFFSCFFFKQILVEYINREKQRNKVTVCPIILVKKVLIFKPVCINYINYR